jgi:hypothetical protein
MHHQIIKMRSSSCLLVVKTRYPSDSSGQSLDSATTTSFPAHKQESATTSTNNACSSMSNSCHRTKPMSPNTTESSNRIRSRYLARLGVGRPNSRIAPMPVVPNKAVQQRSTPVALKQDHGQADDSITIASPPQHSKHKSCHTKVSFGATVLVRSIPHAKDLSARVKRTLWMPPRELEEAIHRNSIEFAAEGWDWHNATGEADFVLIGTQYIHPAHILLRQQCNLQRQFMMIMSAQQQQKQQQQQIRMFR